MPHNNICYIIVMCVFTAQNPLNNTFEGLFILIIMSIMDNKYHICSSQKVVKKRGDTHEHRNINPLTEWGKLPL